MGQEPVTPAGSGNAASNLSAGLLPSMIYKVLSCGPILASVGPVTPLVSRSKDLSSVPAKVLLSLSQQGGSRGGPPVRRLL